ncbi:MAG: hypothetical protein ACXVCG_03020, partial [Bdellovibrionota bacterium]
FPVHSYLDQSPLRPHSFESDLEALSRLIPSLTFRQHLENVRRSVTATRVKLMAQVTDWNTGFLVPLDTFARLFDIVEPVASPAGGVDGEARFDAFSLTASMALSSDPDSFLALLNDTARKRSWNPVFWFYQRHDVPEDRRAALISLVTHNHVSEQTFIRSVILLKGVRAGWVALKNINHLYEAERQYWQEESDTFRMRNDPATLTLLGKSNVGFLNAPIGTLVQPTFLSTDFPGVKATDRWLPMYRTYHYYGGFLIARRMRASFVPRSLAKAFAEFLGSQYKKVSDSKDSPQLKMIQDIYAQASEDAYRGDAFARSAGVKEHLAIFVSARRGPGWFRSVSEHGLAAIIKSNFGNRYDTIDIWTEESGEDPKVFVRKVIAQVAGGEFLDVFSVEHGPTESFVPTLKAAEVEALIPKNLLRNLISSGCSMWGAISTKGGVDETIWRSGFGLHMKHLGVKNYLEFANDGSYWWRMADELTAKLGPDSNWPAVEAEFFTLTNAQTAKKKNGRTDRLAEILYPSTAARPVVGVDSLVRVEGDSRWVPIFDLGDGYSEFEFKPAP